MGSRRSNLSDTNAKGPRGTVVGSVLDLSRICPTLADLAHFGKESRLVEAPQRNIGRPKVLVTPAAPCRTRKPV
jgi:hypothetical protein